MTKRSPEEMNKLRKDISAALDANPNVSPMDVSKRLGVAYFTTYQLMRKEKRVRATIERRKQAH